MTGNLEGVIDEIRGAVSKRLGITVRPSQLEAARRLLTPTVVEMDTGEGKTLATAIAVAALARQGHLVLVATSNDYLAMRDAKWMGGIYDELGLSVDHVTRASAETDREAAYGADVVYGTVGEFGFDQLRGELQTRRRADWVDRFDTLVVDEADSVLIDEARMPLIITAHLAAAPHEAGCFRWSADVAPSFLQGEDFCLMPESGMVALTRQGRHKLLRLSMPPTLDSLTLTEIQHRLEQAIWVLQTMHAGTTYVVDEGRVQVVDEYSGRTSAHRKFGRGVQQAIEAKEGLPLTGIAQPTARITVQDFAKQFSHLCGITGTAMEAKHELRRVYGLTVSRVEPFRPSRRVTWPPTMASTKVHQWRQITEEVAQMVALGRCVLVGTRTVNQSQSLSHELASHKIKHVVLNALNPHREAEIIAQAGRSGRVTVATNMAGRGTDICLDDRARSAGGLHVIVAEPHAAARIDRQMMGRAGRQGDPGSARIFGSAEDEILRLALGPSGAAKVAAQAQRRHGGRWLWNQLRRCQRLIERQHQRERAALAASEGTLAEAAKTIGLDPRLDPLPE